MDGKNAYDLAEATAKRLWSNGYLNPDINLKDVVDSIFYQLEDEGLVE